MIPDLVFDVGLHEGRDTTEYLQMGFRVVAVEPHPELAAAARERFASELADNRLAIVEKAVSETPGRVPFHLHRISEWSSLANDRWAPELTEFRTIEVETVPFDALMAEHGVPLYAKVDIEGGEPELLQGLARAQERPPFLSLELCDLDMPQQLAALGYKGFQVVPQKGLAWTGPFGDLLPDAWLTAEAADLQAREMWTKALHEFWCDLHARL